MGGVKCCDPDSDAVIWSLRTNVLYDAALVPNLGFDLYLSSGCSTPALKLQATMRY